VGGHCPPLKAAGTEARPTDARRAEQEFGKITASKRELGNGQRKEFPPPEEWVEEKTGGQCQPYIETALILYGVSKTEAMKSPFYARLLQELFGTTVHGALAHP
jgi:hypothetical protein